MKYKLNDVLTKPTGDVKCGDKALPALSCTQHEGLVLQSDKYTKQIASEDMSNYWIVHPQQLVTTFHMDKGVLAIWNGTHDGAVSPAYKVWDVNTAIVLPAYLELAMKAPASIRYYLQFAKTTVAGRCAINDKDLLDMPIEIPDMAQQQRVLDILNALEKALQQCQHRIALHDELVKSRFIELFGSVEDNVFGLETIKIKDACDLINGKAFKPEDWSDEGLPIVRIQNLNNDQAPFNFFNGEIKEQYLIDTGELLFSWSGTPGTSFGAFFWNRGKAVLNQHIFRVKPKIEFNLSFLQFALNGRIDYIISKAHGGVGLQHITKKELDEVELLLPALDRQSEFAAFVEQADKSKLATTETLKYLEELKAALMTEYFG